MARGSVTGRVLSAARRVISEVLTAPGRLTPSRILYLRPQQPPKVPEAVALELTDLEPTPGRALPTEPGFAAARPSPRREEPAATTLRRGLYDRWARR